MGKTLPYFHSVRIRVRKTKPIVEKEIAIGQEIECRIIKNKVGAPFGIAETSLFFGIGFDEIRETVEVAYKTGYITPAGAWCYAEKGTPNEMKWNGKNALIAYCRDNPDYYSTFKVNAFNRKAPEEVVITKEEDEDGYEE